MKIQLWMKGRDSSGKVKLYRTITEEEFVRIAAVIMERDGKRPWEVARDEEPSNA